MGRWTEGTGVAAGGIPYLDDVILPSADLPPGDVRFSELADARPAGPITLELPQELVPLVSGAEDALMRRSFADVETLLALHRFAWLPLIADDVDPAWVGALWKAWRFAHGTPASNWAWHPYTAAERAINILQFGRRRGLPGPIDDTLEVLARHGRAILERLEYFGERNTGNHLSNDGRGLFILGLELGIGAYADIGGRILIEEAKRIFTDSGVLREGSSHYHLLLARNYASAWLAARNHDRVEAQALEQATRRAFAVLPNLALQGGVPLIGDISPDCPPAFLVGLLAPGRGETGWCASLSKEDREALVSLAADVEPVTADRMIADGWARFESGPWSGLWHGATEGWSMHPGHGHQDLGSFELHFGTQPLICDPGRGAYGDTGTAVYFASALAHNTLLIDDADPYPRNRPYYGADFRRSLGGPAPALAVTDDGVMLRHHGYQRIRGVGALTRRWRFDRRPVEIADRIEGTGRRLIRRRLHLPSLARREGDVVCLAAGGMRFRLGAEGTVRLETTTRWRAYGEGEPATVIDITSRGALPWEGAMSIEVL